MSRTDCTVTLLEVSLTSTATKCRRARAGVDLREVAGDERMQAPLPRQARLIAHNQSGDPLQFRSLPARGEPPTSGRRERDRDPPPPFQRGLDDVDPKRLDPARRAGDESEHPRDPVIERRDTASRAPTAPTTGRRR